MNNDDALLSSETNKNKAHFSRVLLHRLKKSIRALPGKQIWLHLVKTRYGKMALIVIGLLFGVFFLSAILTKPYHAAHVRHRLAANVQSVAEEASQANALYQDIDQLSHSVAKGNHLTQSEIAQLSAQVQAVQTRAQQLSDENDLQQMTTSLTNSDQLLSQKLDTLETNVLAVKTYCATARIIRS